MNIQKVGQTIGIAFFFVVAMFLMGSVTAEASIEQMKLYKKVFPESKPKCLVCHLDALPKKADGSHNPNSYGQKIIATDEVPTEETYKEVGSAEDFQASDEGVTEETEDTITDEKAEQE